MRVIVVSVYLDEEQQERPPLSPHSAQVTWWTDSSSVIETSQQLNTIAAICTSVSVSSSHNGLVSLSPCHVPHGTVDSIYGVSLPEESCHC